jgi:hypothetical protein
MHSGCLFRCTIFCNATMARKVGQNLVVCQEWPLRSQSHNRFMGMLQACADSGNDDALFLLGMVRTQFLTSVVTAIYLMPIFNGRRSFTNWVQEQRGSNTCSRQQSTDMMKQRTCVGILMVEYNNLAVEVEEALVHVDKFITLSLANPTIQRWIRSVRYDAVLMLIRYENLGWVCRFFHPVQDLPQCHTSGCQDVTLTFYESKFCRSSSALGWISK